MEPPPPPRSGPFGSRHPPGPHPPGPYPPAGPPPGWQGLPPPGWQGPPPGPPPPGPPPGGFGSYPPPGGPAPRRGNGKVIGIVVAVVAGFVLICGGSVTAAAIWLVNNTPGDDGPGAPGPGPGGGPQARTGPVGWWPRTAPGGQTTLDQLWPELAAEFTAADHGEVRLEATPQDLYDAKLATAIAAGDPPDLFYSGGGDELRQQVEDGLVRDLTDDLADVIATVSPGALAPYTVDGRVYGLPYHIGMAGLWYNKALFSEAGLDPDRPPETWDEFLDAVVALKQAGTTPIALGGVENWTASFWFGYLATRVAGVDGIAQARQQRSFSGNPDLLRAAELFEELVSLEPFQPGFEAASYAGPGGQASLMGNGEAAMELMGNWAPLVYEIDAPGGLGDDLGWFRFPAVAGGNGSIGDVYGGGDGFVVGANAPDETIELLRFLVSEENYQRVLDTDSNLMSVRNGAQAPAGDPNLTLQLETIQAAPAFQLYLDQDLPNAVGVDLIDSAGALALGRLDAEAALAQITAGYQDEPD